MIRKETIAAIATGLSESGVGIVRISGQNAVEVGDKLFRSPTGRKILKNAESHMMKYGFVVDVEKLFE
jgi:tRNA modification GTPase